MHLEEFLYDAETMVLSARIRIRVRPRFELGLVGRQRELAQLETSLEQALAGGRGRVVGISAEAGMGKSRLIQELIGAVSDSDVRIVRSDMRLDGQLMQQAMRPLFGRHLMLLSAQEVPPLLREEIPGLKRSAVPDLATVEIHKVYPSTLQVQVTLKPIAFRLLVKQPDGPKGPAPAAASGADFLTQDGQYVVYLPSRVASGASLPLLNIVDWGVRPQAWTQLLSPEFLKSMNDAQHELSAQFGQNIVSRSVYLRAREFHLQTQTYALWFDLQSPISDQLNRYRTFLQTAGPGAAKLYVDLRLADKVVYQ